MPATLSHLIPRPYFGNLLIRYPKLVTVLLFLLLAALALVMLAQERARQLELQRYQLLQTLTNYASELEGAVNSGVVALNSIRSELILQPAANLQRLDQRVGLLLQNYPLFRHVALAPDLVIRYVYPLAGNESIIGVDYRNLPQQMAAIEKTLQLGKPVVAGPVNLLQGGTCAGGQGAGVAR